MDVLDDEEIRLRREDIESMGGVPRGFDIT